MADFPATLKIGDESREAPRDGRLVDQDGDGLTRIRKLHADVKDFDLVLPGMLSSEVTALLAHYSGNSANTFNFLWPPDGVTYVQKYRAAPQLMKFKKGRSTYQVKLGAG